MSDKLAHLQGFIEGSEIDPNTKEGKIIYALTQILEDVIDNINMLEEEVAELGDQVDDIDEDLQNLEDVFYDMDDEDYEDSEDEEDDDDYTEDDDEVTYEITCPNCEETICIDESILDSGSITCPNCGELLEFELEEDEPDDGEPSKEEDGADQD